MNECVSDYSASYLETSVIIVFVIVTWSFFSEVMSGGIYEASIIMSIFVG